MSGRIVARAPGKLFILGEYAVLDGCPAVVAAVDRFAEVSIARTAGPGRFRIEAPQLEAVTEVPVGAFPPVEGPLRFVLAVLHQIKEDERAALLDGVHLTIQSQLTGEKGEKPGLGGSAAVTAAVAAAISSLQHPGRIIDEERRREIFSTAFRAHRAAQGGVGSGADVAASVYGGLIRFEPQADGLPLVTPLPVPPGVDLLVAWTGAPASTVDLAGRYRALTNGRLELRRRFVDRSRDLVESFAADLRNGGNGFEAVRAAGAVMEAFAAEADLPVMTPALTTFLRIAREHGAAAKISGAGGGDCGIAFTSSHSDAGSIRAEWQAAGLAPLPIGIAAKGVTSGES